MSYRRLEKCADPQRAKLVDLIPEYQPPRPYAYKKDHPFYTENPDDYFIHPEWKAMVHKGLSRIPRRIQRYAVICLGLAVVLWFAWRAQVGPKYSAYRELMHDMNTRPNSAYGTQVRPTFTDTVHIKTLEKEHLPVGDKRLVFVGDVHGCDEELKALLQEVRFVKGQDHLVLTGDIVAKGPNSTAVVSIAQDLGADCVRGNNEDKLLLVLADMLADHEPLPGPNEPLGRTPDFMEEESESRKDYDMRRLALHFSPNQMKWLKERPIILGMGNLPGIGNAAVVHAGLVPDISLMQQDPFEVMNMRTIDLKTWVPTSETDKTPWEKFWNFKQKKLPASERLTVLYGHDAKRGLNIQKYSKGLDSNCVRGGVLTALVLDARGKQKYVQVPCKSYVQ